MVVIRPKTNQLYPGFNYYLFRYLQNDFYSFVSGSAQPQLPIKDLNEIEINLPSLPEQKAIAGVLSSLDDKIDLLHRQNKTLEAMAEALFRQWFVEGAEDEWEDNTPSCLVEKNFGGDWGKEYILPDLTQVCCIRGTDIADIQNSIPSRTPIRFIKKSRLLNNDVKIGDLIVEISGGTESQSTGRAMFVHNLTTNLFPFPIYFSNFCRLIRPAKKEYTLFLFHFFRYLYNSDELFSYENGTSGIKNLNYKALLYEEKTKIPPCGLIKKFDIQCMPYWDKILENKIQIRTLEKLRDTLLPKMMSGEVRVMA
jgi:type I restriction enzyme S subunit